MIELRDYQTDLIARVRQSLAAHRAVICQAPTGAGKTALAVYMMGAAQRRGIGSMFVVHRNELVEQTSAALWEQNLQHGLIQSGRSISRMPAQVASVQTLVRRTHKYEPPGLVIVDEAHRAAADTYRRVLDAYPSAKVVGLTATPQRTDGRGLDHLFTDMQCGPSVRWLIDEGYLSDYRIFGPDPRGAAVDLSGVRTRAGDWAKDDLEAAMDRPSITGDAVAHYKRHAMGKRAIGFCVTVNHSRHTCAAFNAAGIPAEHMDGGTPKTERQAILDRFRRGVTWVLFNVELAVEGLDVPAAEALIMLRPTQSVIVHLQAIGRVMRAAPGKPHAIILDHVGNCLRPGLGLPDDDREWSLAGREKRKRGEVEPTTPVTVCKSCFAIFRPAPVCPHCGTPTGVKQRELEQVDGDLHELDPERIRLERKREQRTARGLPDLVALGVRRGYRNPAYWAAITHAARQGRKPTGDEIIEARRAAMEARRA